MQEDTSLRIRIRRPSTEGPLESGKLKKPKEGFIHKISEVYGDERARKKERKGGIGQS